MGRSNPVGSLEQVGHEQDRRRVIKPVAQGREVDTAFLGKGIVQEQEILAAW